VYSSCSTRRWISTFLPQPAAPAEGRRNEFDGVWFAYKDEDWVLRDVTSASSGRDRGRGRPHGRGKTTLISLLLRFYDIRKGSIRVGGVDIHASIR